MYHLREGPSYVYRIRGERLEPLEVLVVERLLDDVLEVVEDAVACERYHVATVPVHEGRLGRCDLVLRIEDDDVYAFLPVERLGYRGASVTGSRREDPPLPVVHQHDVVLALGGETTASGVLEGSGAAFAEELRVEIPSYALDWYIEIEGAPAYLLYHLVGERAPQVLIHHRIADLDEALALHRLHLPLLELRYEGRDVEAAVCRLALQDCCAPVDNVAWIVRAPVHDLRQVWHSEYFGGKFFIWVVPVPVPARCYLYFFFLA